jgi:hypothetical protein
MGQKKSGSSSEDYITKSNQERLSLKASLNIEEDELEANELIEGANSHQEGSIGSELNFLDDEE